MTKNQPTAIYFKNERGDFVCEDVRTVTKPANPWTTRTVITVTGKRFAYDGPGTVLVF